MSIVAEKKEKQYVSNNARLMKEWDWEKNGELQLDPTKLTCGSGRKVWWKCVNGHEWQADIHNRNAGNGCPYCSNKGVIPGENDLQTINPTLANEWNYTKNNGLIPSKVLPKSGKRVWWKCSVGHEWKATIYDRNMGDGCPFCSGRYAISGVTDIKTTNPLLIEEWNYEKNLDIQPENVTAGSSKKVWWKCKKGHEWKAVINTRSRGAGCPICSAELRTSFAEYAFAFYLEKHGIDFIHTYTDFGYELDIYIPALKTAIEYDGYIWHQGKENSDLEKNLKCKKDGIKLYRIREELPSLNDTSDDYIVKRNRSDLSEIIQKVLFDICKIDVDVDVQRDYIAIENLREHLTQVRSILHTNPLLAKEWNYERNGNLLPEHVTSSSHRKVWWVCEYGHEWQAKIDGRSRGKGCPFCSGRFAVSGKNDLQTTNPSLSAEWNYEKNGGMTPADISPNSNKVVWWICKNGHEWKARIGHRQNGSSCPYCSGLRILSGYNDLATRRPDIISDWDYNKNKSIDPMQVGCANGAKVWWKCCSCGREWEMTIAARTRGCGCPQCSRKKNMSTK